MEFGGYGLEKDKEMKGLRLGCVGWGREIEEVEVCYCNDDWLEWFGGRVNWKYVVG